MVGFFMAEINWYFQCSILQTYAKNI